MDMIYAQSDRIHSNISFLMFSNGCRTCYTCSKLKRRFFALNLEIWKRLNFWLCLVYFLWKNDKNVRLLKFNSIDKVKGNKPKFITRIANTDNGHSMHFNIFRSNIYAIHIQEWKAPIGCNKSIIDKNPLKSASFHFSI